MLVFLGYLVILVTVLGGFAYSGGILQMLYQPSEFFIIGGAGLGTFIVGNNSKAIKGSLASLPKLLKGSRYTKALYMELLAMVFLLLTKVRQEGAIAIENDIEDPASSPLFNAYPRLTSDPVLMDFLRDYLRLIISGNMSAFEMEALMDEEIETSEHEHEVSASAINVIGDALPAFGIVAAVMGVINTLASIDRPMSEVGESIAHAMVGTFLGILMAYGFVLPLASLLRQKSAEQIKMLQCIKAILLANLHGYAPRIAVEFGRKNLFSTERPTFSELEEHVRKAKTPAASTESDSAA